MNNKLYPAIKMIRHASASLAGAILLLMVSCTPAYKIEINHPAWNTDTIARYQTLPVK